jgi:hypothetical protein
MKNHSQKSILIKNQPKSELTTPKTAQNKQSKKIAN